MIQTELPDHVMRLVSRPRGFPSFARDPGANGDFTTLVVVCAHVVK